MKALSNEVNIALPPGEPKRPGSPVQSTRTSKGLEQPARILVVEDDFLIAMQTEAALTAAGFSVVGTATTAEEAVALAAEGRPALAIMDIRLGSTRDGIDAARELFEDLDIRCIFATAHNDARTRERAEPYGPLGWLAKPYTMASLVALVNEALSKI